MILRYAFVRGAIDPCTMHPPTYFYTCYFSGWWMLPFNLMNHNHVSRAYRLQAMCSKEGMRYEYG